ncbi:MAG TPA: glycosyltransferase family A protein, partial [Polyangiales bacterium]|nr:glycosyltransferase family A protein [Polyangiales bacterium]
MSASATPARVAVLMPTFEHAHFIERALASLFAQSFTAWELSVVDDGSSDGTREVLLPWLADPRLRYHRFDDNRGLGAALNVALDRTSAPFVAYLPADDVYDRDHLSSLFAALEGNAAAVLAFAHVRHHYNRQAHGAIDGYPLQLVQVMHRRTGDRFVERSELVTDDLDRMSWTKLRA